MTPPFFLNTCILAPPIYSSMQYTNIYIPPTETHKLSRALQFTHFKNMTYKLNSSNPCLQHNSSSRYLLQSGSLRFCEKYHDWLKIGFNKHLLPSLFTPQTLTKRMTRISHSPRPQGHTRHPSTSCGCGHRKCRRTPPSLATPPLASTCRHQDLLTSMYL